MASQEVLNALAQAINEKDIYSTICHLRRLINPLDICEVDIEPETRTDTLWITIRAHSKRGEFDIALSTALFIRRRMRLMKK